MPFMMQSNMAYFMLMLGATVSHARIGLPMRMDVA